MNLSLNALKAIYATETGDYPIILIVITHPELPNDILLSTDGTTRLPSLTTDENVVYGTVSNGLEYMYCPMELDLPTEDEDSPPSTRLSVSNIGREMVEAIRSVRTSPILSMTLVLASDTDNIEGLIEGFKFSSVDINSTTIGGDLVLDVMTNEPCPYYTFTPSTAPGLFK